ncbi:MAG TPA: hypothetical protein DCY35_06130, partial [Prolixibacteraceae bacterium]|nr:hypothetical protein [Prolixibacteraceae bacterium]
AGGRGGLGAGRAVIPLSDVMLYITTGRIRSRRVWRAGGGDIVESKELKLRYHDRSVKAGTATLHFTAG